MRLDLETPDRTTLSRRNSKVDVPPIAKNARRPVHLTIDSTGLEMVGDGELRAHRHETSNKRRSWRKIHLGVDSDGLFVASELTESGVDDSSVGVSTTKESGAEIRRFMADGAYDTTAISEALMAAGAPWLNIVIPPRKMGNGEPVLEVHGRQRRRPLRCSAAHIGDPMTGALRQRHGTGLVRSEAWPDRQHRSSCERP